MTRGGAFTLSRTAIAMTALLAGLSGAAAAQPAADPADAKAKVPTVAYESPFAGYRKHAETAVAPWRGVNDEVGRIGGWKAYAREAYEAAQAEAAKKAAPAVAPPAMHQHGGNPPK